MAPGESHPANEFSGRETTHGAAEATPTASFDQSRPSTTLDQQQKGKRALVQFDYEKAEDNEVELKEGEYVTDIDMVDEDWWWGRNSKGHTGLFPSSYVEIVEVPTDHRGPHQDKKQEEPIALAPAPKSGKTAIAIYDYEAAEDNELSFAEGTEIKSIVCLPHSPTGTATNSMSCRSFQMTTGGLERRVGNQDYSQQTTSSYENDALILG